MPDIERINTQDDLVALASRLGMRPNWHEPDERDVTALVSGHSFDNAGFWGTQRGSLPPTAEEMSVTLCEVTSSGLIPVAEVCLATLFAWACGYRDR
jgi:hypothetical protein